MSDSGNNTVAIAGFLFLSGPIAGAAVYRAIQAKYRNRGARYMPERDVAREVADMVVKDEFVGRHTVSNSMITGRNDHSPAVRAPFSTVTKT